MAWATAAGSPLLRAYSRPMIPCSEVISTTMDVARSDLQRLAARSAVAVSPSDSPSRAATQGVNCSSRRTLSSIEPSCS